MIRGFLWGAICGAVFGWISPETIGAIGDMIQAPDMPHWKVGAVVGFVGGAFKSSINYNYSGNNGSRK